MHLPHSEKWVDPIGWNVGSEQHADTYHAHRSRFTVKTRQEGSLKVFAICPFLLYIDGKWIGEGPTRWSDGAPEYQQFDLDLAAGDHVLAIATHYEGVETRLLHHQPGFLAAELLLGDAPFSLQWKGTDLAGFHSQARRINPELGWIEWCDTRQLISGWHEQGFNDESWPMTELRPWKGSASKTQCPLPPPLSMSLHPLAHGEFTERYGYDSDDSPVQFYLRDLHAHHGKPQGVWRRYDLGRVRLGRWSFELDLPKGAVVTVASSESLIEGRVCPWITLSAGNSANLDRYEARGGRQEFMPHTAKGGRFVEVHVVADPKTVHFIEERFFERSFYQKVEGKFESSDHRLNSVWLTGAHTLQACSEDSIIDNPTRERGQWIGDTLSVGLENGAAAFGDLRPFKKAIVQAASCARQDGLVAGLCPGTVGFLSTYACHWTKAAVRYWELTGDKEFLEECYPAARSNMDCFARSLTDNGLSGDLGWAFIDWGYVGNEGPSDMGLNLIYLEAVRSMIRWSKALGKDSGPDSQSEVKVLGAIQKFLEPHLTQPNSVGLQQRVFAMMSGLIDAPHRSKWVASIQDHYRRCFPNDPMAPNLADPSTAQSRLITPFFSHFALPVLWEHGQGDFALEQYRACWGWALDQGLTTWPEVFDLRWSHCHQWSGCPTWQLSRYVLGLKVRQDLGHRVVEFQSLPSSLDSVDGYVPIPGNKNGLNVSVRRQGANRVWRIQADEPFEVVGQAKFSGREFHWQE